MDNPTKRLISTESDETKRIVSSNSTRLTQNNNESEIASCNLNREFIDQIQVPKKLGRQSNFLAQIDDEVKTGGSINDHLAAKLLQSHGSWRNAMSSLWELKGFLHEQDDTIEEIVSDLLKKIENKEDVTKHVKNLLQGINDNMQKERPCYNCKETGTHIVGKNLSKCNSCHGKMKKKPLAQKTRKIYISGVREILRFFG